MNSPASQIDGTAVRLGTPRRFLVIFNPTAGARRRRRLAAFLAALEAAGAAVSLRETTAPGDAHAFALEAREEEFDVLVVAGGDGTINEALNGLMARLPGRAGLPLALLPLGTANVLARELGLPRDPARAAAVALAGRTRRIALGRANGRHFALMAGIGFDAAVVANLDLGLKRRLRQGAYALETIRQAFRFPFPRYVVEVGGARYDARSVIACKARHYGGPFVLARQASLERPGLTLALFERGGPLAVLRFSFALLTGRLAESRGLRLIEAEAATIEGPAGEAVQGDGDIVARLPLRLEVVPAALELVAPPIRD